MFTVQRSIGETVQAQRDHGGNIDAAVARYGGARADWMDLSTGINPCPYPAHVGAPDAWTALPDKAAQDALLTAARQFWAVPPDAAILAAPGCSALIAQIPTLWPTGTVQIAQPTYNEHAASFGYHGWTVTQVLADVSVHVHPNNPTGAFHAPETLTPTCVIDESFCDIAPDRSLIAQAGYAGRLVLKSFGKFWGLAGLRLGFAIGDPALIDALKNRLGPWAVSGPALNIGTKALSDPDWATQTRVQLAQMAMQLDAIMAPHVNDTIGDVSLFRTYAVADARHLQDHLARHHIWTRTFPYSDHWIRLGLPHPTQLHRLKAAL
ncbi:MAG: threonine-phosphate decarboxylase [Pseudomonadota bacterium]